MNRRLPLVLAAVVFAGGVALFWITRPGPAPAAPSPSARATGDRPAPPPPPMDPSTAGPIAPAPNGPTAPPVADPGNPGIAPPSVKEYVLADGTIVRDHRGGDQAPIMRPTPEPPGSPRRIDTKVVADSAPLVRSIAMDCAKQIPIEAKGNDPVLQVSMLISIKAGVFSVDEVTPTLQDVEGASVDPVKQCVTQRAAALTMDAAGQPDVDHYRLTYPYRLR